MHKCFPRILDWNRELMLRRVAVPNIKDHSLCLYSQPLAPMSINTDPPNRPTYRARQASATPSSSHSSTITNKLTSTMKANMRRPSIRTSRLGPIHANRNNSAGLNLHLKVLFLTIMLEARFAGDPKRHSISSRISSDLFDRRLVL